MPLGYNFLEFVAINLYITSDIVIISMLCLKINCFYTNYGSTIFFIKSSSEDQATYHTEHILNSIHTCRNVKNSLLALYESLWCCGHT
jgi:hypothetical protein